MTETPDYVARNRAAWSGFAAEYVDAGHASWSRDFTWGMWAVPEAEVGMLPDVTDLETLEVGCGTGYVSGWLARAGGRPAGLDPTPEQLATARRFQDEFGVHFPLVRGVGESLPFADESFDLVISEYGASIWSDPNLWVPEAARVLKPEGHLIFLVNAPLLLVCMKDDENDPATSELMRPYFGMHRFDWPDTDEINFGLTHSGWFKLLHAHGFEIENLVEIQPPEGATTRYPFVEPDWARKWPTEDVWKARKTSSNVR
jgi:ubiquinone/menaquinone biosynthesis C-methylase UbiE